MIPGPRGSGCVARTGAPAAPPIGEDEVRWWAAEVPATRRSVPVRVYRPLAGSLGWLVWAHGGSWHAGSLEGWHQPVLDLAARAGVTVVNVGYRLAPRHPHPAPLHDVLAALEWARDNATREGQGHRLAVGGDSAGATIAACAAIVCRDLRRPLAAQVLAYPPTDPECRAASYTRRPGAFPDPRTLMEAWRAHRAAGPAPRLHSTPREAPGLAGVAPALLAVGELDPVADDVRWLRDTLTGDGVRTRYYEAADTGHGTFLTDRTDRPDSGREPTLRAWLADALASMWEKP